MYSWAPVSVPSLPQSEARTRLRLFDTASGENVAIGPKSGTARMYVCGITPYDATHLGHANTYLTFDLIQRVLMDQGLECNYTQNVTDVDDPLLERATQTGQEWDELAADQIDLFRADMEALRVIPPENYVGAVESIGLVADSIERLADTDWVYQIDDAEHPDWYFRAATVPGFGDVSHLDEIGMIESFRKNGGDPDRPGKRHPLDSLLWRFARPDEPAWESALGSGRPGWHVECVSIALQNLGSCFDVQGGGRDLVFPHHEMCAAQARVLTGEPMAKAFVHSGIVALDGEKMSKSKGNLELVSRLRKAGADPMAIRLAVLSHHYRVDWQWQPRMLEEATCRLKTWRSMLDKQVAAPAAPTIAAMRAALRRDLDVPNAIGAVDAWVAASTSLKSIDTEAVRQMVVAIDGLLGIQLEDR